MWGDETQVMDFGTYPAFFAFTPKSKQKLLVACVKIREQRSKQS